MPFKDYCETGLYILVCHKEGTTTGKGGVFLLPVSFNVVMEVILRQVKSVST